MTHLQVPSRLRRLAAPLRTVRFEPRVRTVLCYLPGGVGAVVAVLCDRHDAEIRFHAAQSLLFTGCVTVMLAGLSALRWAPLLSLLGYALTVFAWLVAVALWIALLIAAAGGKQVRLPLIGLLAARVAGFNRPRAHSTSRS